MRRLVLGIAVAVTSFIPVLGMADDQQIADYIKSRLQVEQQQGNLRGFNVDMRVERGTVWFKGHVSNPTQEMTILRSAQMAGHLGVVQVVDEIEVKLAPKAPIQSNPHQNAGYQVPPAIQMARQPEPQMAQPEPQMAQPEPQMAQPVPKLAQPAPQMAQPAPQMAQPAPQMAQPAPQMAQPAPQMAQPAPQMVQPAPQMAPPAPRQTPYRQTSAQEQVGGAVEGIVSGGQPLPFASSGGGVGPAAMPVSYGSSAGMPSEAPNLPGYAWPGYAAHPNYGAVSYPQQYSASAWPYIGPFYPYPQVPLGWRKVSLEWDDGWWMLDFHDK